MHIILLKSFWRYPPWLRMLPIDSEWEVTWLTWPQVTDITDPWCENCRYLCPYETLQVPNLSTKHCDLGTATHIFRCKITSRDFTSQNLYMWVTELLIAVPNLEAPRPLFRYSWTNLRCQNGPQSGRGIPKPVSKDPSEELLPVDILI